MKKIIAITLVCVIAIVSITACGAKNTPNTIKDGKALADVITAVDAKFTETYGADYTAVSMGMPVDQQYLTDFCEIEASNVDEVVGNVSMSMTNSDAFFGVKVKSGKAEAVKTALEKRLADITAQYETYNVSGSYDRAKAGQVYQKGDYVFLIVVGVWDPDAETPDFSKDVEMAKTTIDSMFNA